MVSCIALIGWRFKHTNLIGSLFALHVNREWPFGSKSISNEVRQKIFVQNNKTSAEEHSAVTCVSYFYGKVAGNIKTSTQNALLRVPAWLCP